MIILKITSVNLEISAVRRSQYPTGNLPEFLLVGRSNVGKSSFINTIINRKNYARTSATPGKTQTINFYLVNEEFYLVDAPGYGYATLTEMFNLENIYPNKIIAGNIDKIKENDKLPGNIIISGFLIIFKSFFKTFLVLLYVFSIISFLFYLSHINCRFINSIIYCFNIISDHTITNRCSKSMT